MNKQEAQITSEACNDVQRIDIESIMQYLYTAKGGESIIKDGFSAREMIILLARVVSQMKNALASGAWRFLPVKLSDTNETVYSAFRKIASSLNNGNPFEQWIEQLFSLVLYERQNDIWGGITNTNEEEIEDLKNEARKLNIILQEKLTEISNLSDFISFRKNEIEELGNHLDSEKQRLGRVQAQADDIINDLRIAGLDIATANGRANSFLEQLTINADATQKVLDKERTRFSEISDTIGVLKNEFDDGIAQLTDVNNEFGKTLDSAKEKERQIFGRKEEIDKLLKFAADGTLGGVFSQRQAQMNVQVWMWVGLSTLSILAAAYWAYHVFENYGTVTATGINWLAYLSNVVRTAPAFILAFFCLAQYTKERNIQEEYAFKAAVSMTITAYTEMFDDDSALERTKMLISTVQGVYTPPVLGKPYKPFSFRTKDLAELSKNLLELSKKVQEMSGDILKSAKALSDTDKEKK